MNLKMYMIWIHISGGDWEYYVSTECYSNKIVCNSILEKLSIFAKFFTKRIFVSREIASTFLLNTLHFGYTNLYVVRSCAPNFWSEIYFPSTLQCVFRKTEKTPFYTPVQRIARWHVPTGN